MEHAVQTPKGSRRESPGPASPHAAVPAVSPLHPVLQLQQEAGNQAVQELLRSKVVQPWLSVSRPDDPDEQEANQAANQIMRSSESPEGRAVCPCMLSEDGPCPECKEKETKLRLRTSGAASVAPAALPGVVTRALHSPGAPLDGTTRAFMEPRFGSDFSRVRVHTDEAAARSANELGAHAYTIGDHVVFAAGQYSPTSSAGRGLLAHELTHVVQQGQSGRGTVANSLIQRQVNSPATAPTAQSETPGPNPARAPDDERGPERPSSDWYYFRGVMMTADPEFMKAEMRRLISRSGLKGADMWYDALLGRGIELSLPFSAYSRAYGGLRVRSPLDAQRDLQEDERRKKLEPVAKPLAIFTYPVIRAEALIYLERFREELGVTLGLTLRESESRLDQERIRYGLTREGEGVAATYRAKQTVAFQGLVGAAKDLWKQSQQITSLAMQQGALVRSRGKAGTFVPEANQPRYDALGRQIADLEKEYQRALAGATLRYPALGAILDEKSGLVSEPKLNILAQGALQGHYPSHGFSHDSSLGTAGMIGDVLDQRQRSIDDVRDGIRKDPDKLWKLDSIVSLTRLRLHTSERVMADRLITDKIQEVISDETWLSVALGVLAFALAIVAAIPSGGSSLVAAGTFVAGVGAASLSGYQLVKSIQNYELEMALTSTDLDKRARAIATEEPSLFWVAVDVVGFVADGAQALKAFRGLKSAVRGALYATEGAEAAEAARVLQAAADHAEGASPGLGRKLLDTLERIRGRKSAAARALGTAGEAEIAAVTRAGEAIAHEAKTAETLATVGRHELKVTRSGHLVVCTECLWLRERYARELAEGPASLQERLAKAEENALRARSEGLSALDAQSREEMASLARDLESAQQSRLVGEAALEAGRSPAEQGIITFGEQAAAARQVAEEFPGIIEKLRTNRLAGRRTINLEALTSREQEVLAEVFPNHDLHDLTLADLQAAHGNPGAEATRLYELQEKAIRDLAEANRPLYDKVRAASPTERVRGQVLKRARGLDEVSGAAPVSGALDVDHIVPLREIVDMPGFKNLPWSDQVDIVNMVDNFKAVDRAANRSRGALSWAEWPGRTQYSPDALRAIQAQEAAAREAISKEIARRAPAPTPSVR